MSVLITGVEIPKEGDLLCINIYPNGKVCMYFDLDCKQVATAVPVPPHGRLGDMDAIARKIRRFGDYVDFTKDEIARWFENGDFETIIPAEEGGDGE